MANDNNDEKQIITTDTNDTMYKKVKFLEFFEMNYGIVAPTCKSVNIGRKTFYRWYEADEWFKEKVDEIKEMQIDFVEAALLKNIKNGKELSQIFFLKTKGKERGYIEKQEVDNKFDKDFVFKVEVVDNANTAENVTQADSGAELPN